MAPRLSQVLLQVRLVHVHFSRSDMDSRTFEEIAKRIKSVEDGLSSITESARNLKSTSDTDKKKLANLEYRLSQLEKAIETPEDDVSGIYSLGYACVWKWQSLCFSSLLRALGEQGHWNHRPEGSSR